MYTGLNHLHSSLRYLLLLALLVAVINALVKRAQGQEYTLLDDRINLAAFGLTHLQLLLGLILYAMNIGMNGPVGQFWADPGVGMANDIYRFYAIEHLVGMLVAVALITVGRIVGKRSEGPTRHLRTFLFYGFGLALIIASIPWPFRGLGQQWI